MEPLERSTNKRYGKEKNQFDLQAAPSLFIHVYEFVRFCFVLSFSFPNVELFPLSI